MANTTNTTTKGNEMKVYLAFGFYDYEGSTFLAAFATEDEVVAYLETLGTGSLDEIAFDYYGYYIATLGATDETLEPVYVEKV